MNKTLLVALREYMENLRTKTFWIGILSLPVILVLAILVPMWLSGVKDVRRYAVIDQSGWLWPAVQERMEYDDGLRLLRFLQEQAKKGGRRYEKMPALLRLQADLVKNLSPEQLEATCKMAALMGHELTAEDLSPEKIAAQAGTTPEELSKAGNETMEWMLGLSPAEAREIGAGIKRGDYELMAIEELPPGDADLESRLRDLLNDKDSDLFAYFVIGEDPVKGSAGCRYVSNNLTDQALPGWITRLASAEVRKKRLEEKDIAPEVAAFIEEGLEFEAKQVTAEGEEAEVEDTDIARKWAPVAFVYMLWIAVFTIAQMLLTNTIEEKSNRIIEVLLSSVSPLQLMAGKILGIAITGLTVVVSWVISFVLVMKFLPGMIGAGDLPFDLSVIAGDPVFLSSFVLYFLLGYLLYAAILVGFGSVCNSLKEAQNLMQPVFILLIVPLLAMMPIGEDPNGTLARVLSYFPPFTPFVMMNRAAGPPDTWEYVVTTILMLISIAFAFWVAAKVFRIGILMTGKPPRVGEILRWIRTPVGVLPDTAGVELASSEGVAGAPAADGGA